MSTIIRPLHVNADKWKILGISAHADGGPCSRVRTLAAFFLVEKQWPEKERRKKEEERREKNAKYYGHYVVCTAPLGPKVNSVSKFV